jgi:hypothetical protein
MAALFSPGALHSPAAREHPRHQKANVYAQYQPHEKTDPSRRHADLLHAKHDNYEKHHEHAQRRQVERGSQNLLCSKFVTAQVVHHLAPSAGNSGNSASIASRCSYSHLLQ